MFCCPSLIRRLLIPLFFLLCLLAITLPVWAQDASQESITAHTSLVRARPDPNAMVIGRLEEGAPLTVLAETKDFFKIDCYDMIGYISKTQVGFDPDGGAFVRCDPDAPETVATQYIPLADALEIREAVMALAQKQLGVPYRMGGTTPSSFDCSGFTWYVMKHNNFPIRRTVSQQLQDMVIISREHLLPGDLVFFSDGSSFSSHVGIYVGDNKIIHAGSRGIGYADLDGAYFSRTYLCVRRILNVASWEVKPLPSAALQNSVRVGTGLRTID